MTARALHLSIFEQPVKKVLFQKPALSVADKRIVLFSQYFGGSLQPLPGSAVKDNLGSGTA